MATTSNIYPGLSGGQTDFSISFEYLDTSHVKATVNGVAASFAFLSTYLIRMDAAPVGELRIYRETQTDPMVTYSDGSVLVDDALNLSTYQSVYLSEELRNETLAAGADGHYDAEGLRISNVADPVDDGDATNRAWVLALTSVQGPQGVQGPAGPEGPTGPTGVAGPDGPAGPTGPQGIEGPQGPAGPQGIQGIQGAQGLAGPTGSQGPTGSDGAQGPAGIQGPQGSQGVQGIQGSQGIQGDSFVPNQIGTLAGRDAYDGEAKDFAYLDVDNGYIYWKLSATSGDWSSAIYFGRGPAGPTGPQGVQGDQGPQGEQGPQGIQGIQGNTGATGPEGPQGPQGIQGVQGIQGDSGLLWRGPYDGLTAYLVDDAVSYQGSSYIAILGGTGNLPTNTTYWQLIASKGDDGADGAAGATGATGATGPTGPQGIAGVNWRGTYSAAVAYAVKDGVQHNESSWICDQATTGNDPAEGSAYWTYLAKGVDPVHTHDDRYYTESEMDASLAGKVPTSRTVSAGTGLSGGGNLTANRTISANIASQAEAEAGSNNTKLTTPLRVAQAVAALGGGSGAPSAILEDRKASGGGGSFSSGAWRHRDINTEVYDPDNLISISSNQFTVVNDGWVEWTAPGYRCEDHMSRLYNVTNSTVASYGTYGKSDNQTDLTQDISFGGARVEAGKTYRIEHRCNVSASGEGFGRGAAVFGQTHNTFTRVLYWSD